MPPLSDRLCRWQPTGDIPELPLTIFDLAWEGGEERLVVKAQYVGDTGSDTWGEATIEFEAVWSFKVYEEFMEPFEEAGAYEWPQLAAPVPYGGCYPFVEVMGSTWLSRLAQRRVAGPELRHFLVASRNMNLHVAAQRGFHPKLTIKKFD
jgi:hypothetical protein